MKRYFIDGKEISNNMRAERNRTGLTQEQVADIIGISTKTYISYEKNAKNIKATAIYKLSKVFNCTIDAFYVQRKSTKRE